MSRFFGASLLPVEPSVKGEAERVKVVLERLALTPPLSPKERVKRLTVTRECGRARLAIDSEPKWREAAMAGGEFGCSKSADDVALSLGERGGVRASVNTEYAPTR